MSAETPGPAAGTVLGSLDSYVYGTMALGEEGKLFEQRLAMARYAMDRCGWFHTSHKYGRALDILGLAFRERPGSRPRCICKLSGDSVPEVRVQVELQLKALGTDRIDIGQLHFGDPLAADFNSGGPALEGLRALKAEGLVGAFTIEIHPWTSWVAVDHIRKGQGRDLIEGFSFYYNPLQRFALNELFRLVKADGRPILALRSLGGGSAETQASRPESHGDYLRRRSLEILPLFRASGRSDWVAFCLDFALGRPGVATTIGSCSTPAHLDRLLACLESRRDLEGGILAGIDSLHTKWSESEDRFAAPWSM